MANIYKSKSLSNLFKSELKSFEKNLTDSLADFDEEIIHDMRLNVKNLRGVVWFLSFASGIKKKTPLDEIFRIAGKIREIQVNKRLVTKFNLLESDIELYIQYLDSKLVVVYDNYAEASINYFINRKKVFLKTTLRSIRAFKRKELKKLRVDFLEMLFNKIKKLNSHEIDDLHEIRKTIKRVKAQGCDYIKNKKIKCLKKLENAIGEWHDLIILNESLIEFTDLKPTAHINFEELHDSISEKHKEVLAYLNQLLDGEIIKKAG